MTDAPDYTNMTDDEFMKLERPTGVVPEENQRQEAEPEEKEEVAVVEETPEETVIEKEPVVEETTEEVIKEEPKEELEVSDGEEEKPKEEVSPEQTKAEAYDLIMAPFKANGKEIKLNSPQEAIQLMQMGANYTKKLQALQPHLKVVKTLENNGISEEKLNYLIDLDKKNPEAIKKLLIDAKIDPMDIDTSVEPKYIPARYSPSDQQMAFDNVVQELVSSDVGKETLVLVNKEWDKASKERIYREPVILQTIAQHKANGIYDRIAAEVEKQKMLGNYGGVPYINSYYEVGMQMQNQGLLGPVVAPQVVQTQVQQPQVIETKVVTPPPKSPTQTASNGDKAKAASPTKTAAPAGKVDYNPLSMSDEEFTKQVELAGKV